MQVLRTPFSDDKLICHLHQHLHIFLSPEYHPHIIDDFSFTLGSRAWCSPMSRSSRTTRGKTSRQARTEIVKNKPQA
jgi:hypothetical protein